MGFGSGRRPRARRRPALVAAAIAALALAGAAPAGAATGGGGGEEAVESGPTFVIGDQNASVGSPVLLWGAQWSRGNQLSGGAAPAAFKGFADSPSLIGCGTTWTTNPGNSSSPPAGPLPEYMDVIVSSEVSKSGPIISGNTVKIVLVRTSGEYAPDPGHPATGTVVGVLCG
jgi:hypothetical protein